MLCSLLLINAVLATANQCCARYCCYIAVQLAGDQAWHRQGVSPRISALLSAIHRTLQVGVDDDDDDDRDDGRGDDDDDVLILRVMM